ncbi:MAG: pyruvate dehydrogenase (acetyl-transferring) E1 component subunit alpha [Gammaproteobacteria bacterium]|nr:pyruvate dehydrogenase (acetyl-transferring) E1 component subunit alpha [Gammaproteobacteria bacterium]
MLRRIRYNAARRRAVHTPPQRPNPATKHAVALKPRQRGIALKKTVAEYRIEHLQVLDPQGELVSDLPDFARDPEQLLSMYRLMTLTRTFDTKAINLQRTGKLGTYASSLGHEAAHVGIGSAMRDEDIFAPMYREYGAQLWRGVKMSEVLLYWGGDERGNDFSGPRHDFPWCVPIATQCLHAAGAAMACKLRGEKRCAVTVIGDGGTSEGAFYEALNLAGAQRLPMMFVVVNNKWAISVPLHLQTAAETLAQKGIAAGIRCVQVDGNDVLAVRAASEEALARARAGEGATLMEAVTYRLSDHTTADDATRYRPKEEVEEAWEFEPLLRIRKYLQSQSLWDEQREEDLLRECANKVDAAVEEYLNTARMPVSAMFDHMYDEMPESLQEQREIAIRYEGSGGGH